MPATISVCERNGPSPGVVTENIFSINWKNLDDSTTPYSNFKSAINLGSNSYVKYNYIRFGGAFTSLGNVTVTHLTGSVPQNVKLMCNQSTLLDGAKPG